MSRRKQAKPIRHTDDELDGAASSATASFDKQASLASLSEADDDNEDLSCCVHCSLRFATEQERTDHEVICTQRVASKSHSAEIHRADRANNNSANRRRKRDNDFSEEEEEEEEEDTTQATNDLSADEMEPKSGSLPKKQARDEDILGSDRIPEGSNLSSVLNPLIPNGLFPYAATIANANVTLDALQNTKMALAQYAATALAKNGQDNPAALQELAVVQSTLYALQQQQLIQLQLLQQLQQQLHISQTEGHQPVPENLLNMFGYIPNLANEPANSSNGSRTPTPGLESYPADKETPQCGSAHDEQLPSYNSHISNVEQTTNEQSSNESNEESKQSPSKPSFSTTFAQSTCSVPYGSALSQLPGGSLADMILQTSEPPPNPDGPSTLEMLQRTAQQVLNNASQGLLATNLADELGLRSNGGSSGDGKKDQMFKHRCRYCGKVFSSDSALQIHIRSHTGERPFKCNICGNRFTTKGNLKVHFQRHAARFPHVKMNPHPVPEHLDKFYPPLLAQMDIEESKLSPSNPGVPFSHPATSPGSQTHRPTPTGLSASLSSPFSRPVANTSDHPPPTRVNAKHLSLHSLMREGSLITVSQESPENLTKAPQSEPAPVEKDEQEPGNLEVSVKTEKCDVDDEELQPSQATLPNADVSVSEKSENFGDARNFSHDELSQESHYDSQDYNVSNNTQLDNEINKDCSNMEAPEDLSGRRSSASVSSSPSSTANPVAMGSGLPFNPVNLAPLAGPQLRFSLPFPLPGPLGNFPSGVVMREPSPTASGITLQTPAGPIMLPPDIDPAKDPAIYTNLLPRPGSNDNSWESLIEITKTSETSKLQQLVDNIENKLVDPNQCVVCHRVLSCKSALQMHYRTHTGERPFKCKICSRAFTTKGNLKTHMGVHRAKPPARMLHMCPVCHKKFTNGFVLQQHIRLHTGEPTDLTPDQIQAAEVRDFPAPFPFIGGFHPFLPHAPFAPMAMPHPFGPNPGGRPFAFHFRQDAAAKEGAEGQEGQEGDINTEGSSSGALSPASSSTSSHFVTTTPAKNDGVNEVGQSVLRCPTEEDWRKYKEFNHNEESQGRKSPANSEAGEFHFAVKKAMSEDGHPETQGSRSPSPAPNATKTSDFVESHSAKELSDNHKSSNETAEPHSERFYNWLTAQSNFLDRSLTVQKSEPDTVKPGASLPNLSSRHPPTFFPGFNILPPGSVSPSAAANSALSSLTSAVMTQPSFNPLNLPISAPGRGNTTCNICFKTFACHSALEIHYRSHTKERPFKCTICDRGFSTKGNMKQHMMTHKNRDGTPLLLCDKSNERSPRSRDSSASEREQPLETLNKRETNLKSTTNKEMESIELSSINSAAPKEHCLSLTIQRSGDAQNGLPKITDHKQPTIAQQNKTQSSQGMRGESYGEDRPSFISGYEARLAGIVRPNMATETQFHVHGASTSRTILPIAPTAMP